MSTPFFLALTCALGLVAGCVYYYSARAVSRREARRLTQALTVNQAIFSTLDDLPNNLITRDLRRALVLLTQHYIETLADIAPRHPHLYYLQTRQQRLNRIPSGFERTRLRSKADRKKASIAFEKLAGLLKTNQHRKIIGSKDAELATAAAKFAAQQIAVETARQAAKDAENVRAYKTALNFAYQAESLCTRLPPLVGKALAESVAADVQRLESHVGRPARI